MKHSHTQIRLTEKQKKSKVTNYFSALRRAGLIESTPEYKWKFKSFKL